MNINKRLLFFPLLFLGVFVLFLAIETREAPALKPQKSKARPVDLLTLVQEERAPTVTGFGRVAPKLTWQGIAQVSGKVIFRSPLLEKGALLPKGTLLLRLDPSDYQLAVAKAQAEIRAKTARLEKLHLDEKNTEAALEIEQRRWALNKEEWERKKKLNQKGLSSQSDLDDEQHAFLSQQIKVVELENQLLLLPDEKEIIEAELEVSRLVLLQAIRDLEKTSLFLPFDGQISNVNIERDQFVSAQQTMVEAQGLMQVEVEAQVSIHDMQVLLSSLSPLLKEGTHQDIKGLSAEVRVSSGGFERLWPATVARLSDKVHLNQATLGVILEISLKEGLSKENNTLVSLVNGMFVEARITGASVSHWVIPERALHGDEIYLFENDQLKRLPVRVVFRQNEEVIIEGAISSGQFLVLNDLLPAVTGMGLFPLTLDGKKGDEIEMKEDVPAL